MSNKSSNNAAANPPPPQSVYVHRNRRVSIPEGVMAVGLIVGAHGLRGEVRVEPHTDFAQRFAKGNSLLLGVDLVEMRIRASRPHKDVYLVLFDGIDNRTDAEALRGLWLFIPEEEAAPLEDGRYWIHDLIGMEVKEAHGRVLGTVTDILSTGANDVYLVQPALGVNRDQEILLPAIADVIQSVDAEQRTIIVKLMPGLLDEDENSRD